MKKLNSNKLPIAELHVHAEGGTVTPEILEYLAKQNNMPVPNEIFGPNSSIKYNKGDFLNFLEVYDEVDQYIRTAADLKYVLYDYLRRSADEGVIYTELTCSPDHFKSLRTTFSEVKDISAHNKVTNKKPIYRESDLNYKEFVTTIAEAIDAARQDFGIEARVLMVLLRHNGPEKAAELLDNILAYPHPYVVGLNLAGDEVNFPAILFADAFSRAKQHGLKLTAHAGEHADAKSIIGAVKVLQLDRVGHGVASAKDEGVMAFLKENNIGLEVCPSSNVHLGVISSMQEHPFRKLYDYGIACSLNSDDPPYFETTIGNEFNIAKTHWNFTDVELLKITRSTIKMAFCEASLKDKLLSQIDLYEEMSRNQV